MMSGNNYANMSVQLNEFGGCTELVLNKMSLQSYYDTFNENDVDNTLIIRKDVVLNIFYRLAECGHVGILLDNSTVWVFFLKDKFEVKDVVISKWIILMKFPTQLSVNTFVYSDLLHDTAIELRDYLTLEERGLLQRYIDKMIGEDDE